MRRHRLFPRLSSTSFVLAILAVGLSIAGMACAAELAPLNPAFQAYMSETAVSRALDIQTTVNYGYIPSPVDMSHTKGLPSAFTTRAATSRLMGAIPSAYDLRSLNKLTPVKDQANSGSCWAFAALGSLESFLMPDETWDFSENNLKNTHGFNWDPNTGGGNWQMATAVMARWGGPVLESDDPFSDTSTTSSTSYAIQKHLQDSLSLPDRASSSDNDIIKQAIIDYGAVYTSFYYGASYYNSSTNSYYCPYTGSGNHAVCIVGWDDDYSASNFSARPAGNGAFIVKNSWSPAWGDAGYFYVSYYDVNFGIENGVFTAEKTNNYGAVYQYDPLGWTASFTLGSTTGWGANVFTATSDISLAAVGTYAISPNTTYTLSVYLSPSNGPLGSTAALTTSGTMDTAGYHTIKLPSTIDVSSGQKFSVVVRFTTPGWSYPIPVEYPIDGYSSAATSSAGQSYVGNDGSSWSDITTYAGNTNVCIKAFTAAADTAPKNVSLSPTSGELGTEYTKFSAVYSDEDGASDIADCYFLINVGSSGAGAVYLRYNRANNLLYVRSDDNSSWVDVGSVGASDVLENSQCKLSCANTTVSATSNKITVNWSVALKGTYSDSTVNAYMKVVDAAGLSDGWTQMGTFTTNVVPSAVSVTPAAASVEIGKAITLTTKFRDPNGFGDLSKCSVLVNNKFNFSDGVYAYFDAATKTIYLANDNNDGWAGSGALGSATVLANSRCKISCADTTITGSGTDLTVNWSMTFLSPMAGKTCNTWMAVSDAEGNSVDWTNMYTYFKVVYSGCSNVSFSPVDGSYMVGNKVNLTAAYKDPSGYAHMSECLILVSDEFDLTNAIYLSYNPTKNQIRLANDTNTAWSAYANLGSSKTLTNSQCTVYCSGSSAKRSGGNLQVKLSVAFKQPMAGKTCEAWMKVSDKSGNVDGWDDMGASFPVVANAPINVSVSPTVGSYKPLERSTFVATYSHPKGNTTLTECYLMINDSYDMTDSVVLCYNRATDKIRLSTDSGGWTAWTSIKSTKSLQNSQCILYPSSTIVSKSGSIVKVTWRVAFKSTMLGKTCNSWMMVKDKNGAVDGWDDMGTSFEVSNGY